MQVPAVITQGSSPSDSPPRTCRPGYDYLNVKKLTNPRLLLVMPDEVLNFEICIFFENLGRKIAQPFFFKFSVKLTPYVISELYT